MMRVGWRGSDADRTQFFIAVHWIYLGLGVFREVMSISPMDMDVGTDLILGWGWISSHDLSHRYAPDRVSLRSGPALLQLDLLPASTRPAARALPVISHGEFRRLLRQIERESPVAADTPLAPPTPLSLPETPRRSTGWSRPVHADHAELASAEAPALRTARARHRPGCPAKPQCTGRFADGVEVLKDGTVLHFASFCLADAELRLEASTTRRSRHSRASTPTRGRGR